MTQKLKTSDAWFRSEFALRFSLCRSEEMVKKCVDISSMHRRQCCRIAMLRKYLLWIFLVIFGILLLHFTSLPGFSSMNPQVDENLILPSSKTHICLFFGTRPEIIKLAPVIHAFLKSNHFQVVTIFTGQHPHLINSFLEIFDIFVDIFFDNILNENQSIASLIGKTSPYRIRPSPDRFSL